jgi:ADP-ribosylation factor 1/2
MGNFLEKIKNIFSRSTEIRTIMVGLDAVGKSTILYKLKLEEYVTTIPTIGFNVETVKYNNINMNIWDLGGQDKIRPLWRHYYTNTNAIIFVIDSVDRERINDSNTELCKLLEEPKLANIPLLIYANKQDLQNTMTTNEIIERYQLYNLKNRNWYLQCSSAYTGDGIYEGLEWLSNNII